MNIYNELLNHFSALKEQAEKEKNHYIFYNNGIFLTRDRRSDARYPMSKTAWYYGLTQTVKYISAKPISF